MNTEKLKQHPKYPTMFFFKKNRRWSKDFYNLSRAHDLAYNDEIVSKVVGQLPHGAKAGVG